VNEVLDEQYLIWLYSQVGNVKDRNRSRTYWNLFRQLYSIEFVWLVPNDDNRVEDGRDLRYEWIGEHHQGDLDITAEWLGRGCSFLEMLIALCRRTAFEADSHPDTWFWHLLNNLGLLECTDRSNYDPIEVDDRIHTVIQRTYERDGRGGLFPMRHAQKDQRRVELWYQMNAYLLEG
jgi:hypothetical protein